MVLCEFNASLSVEKRKLNSHTYYQSHRKTLYSESIIKNVIEIEISIFLFNYKKIWEIQIMHT